VKKHKDKSKRERKYCKLNTAIRKYGGISNWTFNGLETGTTETHFEMKAREKFFCDELKPDLNRFDDYKRRIEHDSAPGQ
jgi:hypothetical protein